MHNFDDKDELTHVKRSLFGFKSFSMFRNGMSESHFEVGHFIIMLGSYQAIILREGGTHFHLHEELQNQSKWILHVVRSVLS